MRHLSILKGAASCLLALSFVACSDSDSTTKSVAGTVGDITLDRQTIGAYQPFTAQCAVASGSNLYDEKFYWEKGGTEDLSSLRDQYETKDGISSYYMQGMKAGKHTLVCKMAAVGNDGQQYTAEKTFTVEIVPTDIRNNFWGETQEETRRNLTYYTTMQQEADGGFTFEEKDAYGDLNYSTELQDGISVSPWRLVSLEYDEAGKLERVVYICIPSEVRADAIVSRLGLRKQLLERYEGFTSFAYDCIVGDGVVLTDEEQAMVDQFKGGSLTTDSGTALDKAVAEQRVKLELTAENNVSRLRITVTGMGTGSDAQTQMVFSQK